MNILDGDDVRVSYNGVYAERDIVQVLKVSIAVWLCKFRYWCWKFLSIFLHNENILIHTNVMYLQALKEVKNIHYWENINSLLV